MPVPDAEGCGVYEDRPAACRYYALGLTSMRKKDSPADEDMYFVVKEPHCQGHASIACAGDAGGTARGVGYSRLRCSVDPLGLVGPTNT